MTGKDLRFWPPGALAKHDFGIPTYLVEPIIPSSGLVLLHGKRETGKTQLALTLALAIVAGAPFLSLYPTSQGSALLFQVDMQPTLTQQRIRMNPAFDGISILTSPTRVDIEQMVYAVPDAVKQAQSLLPTVVIVDSLRKIMDGDENDSDQPVRIFGALRSIFPGSSIIVLHHDRKTSELGSPEEDEAFRGSGAWLDEPDTGLHLVRDKKQKGHVAKLIFSKTRTCERPDPLSLRMDPKTLLFQPAELTPEWHATKFLSDHPKATKHALVTYLQSIRVRRAGRDQQLVEKTRAYEIARELGLG